MERAIIVAKFREDITWLASLSSNWQRFVYSKDPDESSAQCIKLPNIGRETHTYLHFIIEHYDSLPDLCVFTQGNPFDHCPNFLERVEALAPSVGFEELSNQEIVFDCYGNPHLTGKMRSDNGQTLKDFYERLFGVACPTLMHCRANGLFAVSKERILNRPLSFYKQAIEALCKKPENVSTIHNTNIMEGHFFERLWHQIFATKDEFGRSVLSSKIASRIEPQLQRWKHGVLETRADLALLALKEINEILNKELD